MRATIVIHAAPTFVRYATRTSPYQPHYPYPYPIPECNPLESYRWSPTYSNTFTLTGMSNRLDGIDLTKFQRHPFLRMPAKYLMISFKLEAAIRPTFTISRYNTLFQFGSTVYNIPNLVNGLRRFDFVSDIGK